jgi:hypothetical protein
MAHTKEPPTKTKDMTHKFLGSLPWSLAP